MKFVINNFKAKIRSPARLSYSSNNRTNDLRIYECSGTGGATFPVLLHELFPTTLHKCDRKTTQLGRQLLAFCLPFSYTFILDTFCDRLIVERAFLRTSLRRTAGNRLNIRIILQ